MNDLRHDETGSGGRDWFVRTAAFVGDFGNPFYREERQRDVWNEASAVGFQLILWLTLVAAAVAVWAVGAPALPFAALAVGVVGLASLVTIAYATRLGVTLTGADLVLRPRLVPYAVVVVVLTVGTLRAAPPDGTFSSSFLTGAGIGTAAALLVLLVRALLAQRRAG